MQVRSYNLPELEQYANNPSFGDSKVIPVSPSRLHSYLSNPRALKSDRVLFELYDGDRLVAYRTLLPDEVISTHGMKSHFAWLSGNFVLPGYRRQGLSTRLFHEVEEAWAGKLMYTNYAPASRAVYDQTGSFLLLRSRPGKRAYLRSTLHELLGSRIRLGRLPGFTDRVLNKRIENRLKKFEPDPQEEYNITTLDRFSSDLAEWIKEQQQGSLFDRETEEFNWILDHPWVEENTEKSLAYPFTYRADLFRNRILKFSANHQVRGILWMVLNNRKMSVPYCFTSDPGVFRIMAEHLLETMIRYHCGYLTTRNPGLITALKEWKKWFIGFRNMPQHVFVHRVLAPTIPPDGIIHDGDGDVAFTG